MSKTKNLKRIAPNLKASTVRKLLRQGKTLKAIAYAYGFAAVSGLYDRFGGEIKGIAKKGRPAFARQVAV